MLQTIEAVINTQGHIQLSEKVKLNKKQRVLVTILDDEKKQLTESSIVGSIEILDDDLESGSRQISEMFNSALMKSAEDLRQ
jgi:hypothetical protein